MLTHTPPSPERMPFRVANQSSSTVRVHRRAAIWLCCGIALLALSGCRPVPQVVNDEAVFGELDALYTAVTSKRPQLLNDCRARLTKLHEEKRLSETGFIELSDIMGQCDDEDWDTAAQKLYAFMRAQRKTEKN